MQKDDKPSKMTPEQIKSHQEQIQKDRFKLDEMIAGRKQLRAKLKDDFGADLTKHFTPEEIEAIEVAPATEATKIILNKFDDYAREAIESADAEISEFQKEVDDNHSNLEKISEVYAFHDEHPDLDEDDFNEWLDNDLPVAKIREIQATPTVKEGLEIAYELYQKAKGIEEKKEPELPADLDGVPADGGDIDNGEGEGEDNNLMAMYGMNK